MLLVGEEQQRLAEGKPFRNPGPDVSHLLHTHNLRLEVFGIYSQVDVLSVRHKVLQKSISLHYLQYFGCISIFKVLTGHFHGKFKISILFFPPSKVFGFLAPRTSHLHK